MIKNLDSKISNIKTHLTVTALHLTYAGDSQKQELAEKVVVAELNAAFAEINEANKIIKQLILEMITLGLVKKMVEEN